MKGKTLVPKIGWAFPPNQTQLFEEPFYFLDELVKVHDFNELKGIVSDLGAEIRKVAEIHKRTKERSEALAEAQRTSEEKIEDSAGEQRRLVETQRRVWFCTLVKCASPVKCASRCKCSSRKRDKNPCLA